MNLEVGKLADKGSYERERLVIRVKSADDAGDFILIQAGWNESDNQPTTRVHHALWFPNVEVKSGDLVVVYTKVGRQSSKKTDGGNTSHFFYWGLKESIWEASDRCAVLLHAPTWSTKGPKEL